MTGDRPYVERSARERAFLQVRGIAVSLGMQSRVPGMEPRDIVSELMLYLWAEVLPRYDPTRTSLADFAAWTLRKRISSLLKRAYRFKMATTVMHTGSDAVLWESLPDDAADVAEVAVSRAYASELAPLLRAQMTALERRVVEAVASGIEIREAADVLGIGYKSADNALHRARLKFRRTE